jgi:hypothetical protein
MGLITTYVAKPTQPASTTGMIRVVHLVTMRVLAEDMLSIRSPAWHTRPSLLPRVAVRTCRGVRK